LKEFVGATVCGSLSACWSGAFCVDLPLDSLHFFELTKNSAQQKVIVCRHPAGISVPN